MGEKISRKALRKLKSFLDVPLIRASSYDGQVLNTLSDVR